MVSALAASGDIQGGNWREALNFWEGKGDCSDGPAEMESPAYNILPLDGPAMIENAAMNFPEVCWDVGDVEHVFEKRLL